MAEYRKCSKGHTIYGDWCECKRLSPAGTEVYVRYARRRNGKLNGSTTWIKER